MSSHQGSESDSPCGLSLLDALGSFHEASPLLLQARALLELRVERKYVVPHALCDRLLASLRPDFAVVRSAGRPVASYDTLYFDTPDRQLYHDHRRGRRPRCKVRIRHHLDRALSFLEIKTKAKGDQGLKVRKPLPFGQRALDAGARAFIDAHCAIGAVRLVPSLSITVRRITLIGVAVDERVTIDSDFECGDGCRTERLPGVMIAEIKQARYSNTDGAARAFRMQNVRERALSKYCLATARLVPVRVNAFKPAFRAVERRSR
jgi:hypothetical protein